MTRGGGARYSPLRGYPTPAMTRQRLANGQVPDWTRTAAAGHAGGVTHIIRYLTDTDPGPVIGVRDADGVRPLDVPSLGSLLASPAAAIREAVEDAVKTAPIQGQPALLPPADGRMEIWAAGVTYHRSRDARLEESGGADIYQRVYEADRPELFFKSVPWRVVTDAEPIAVRRDSPLNVPEAELAIVVNAAAEIVGYTVCDDVSSRAIEGENPLYLPQAKIYAGACALAPAIRPAWEVDAGDLAISMRVTRGDAVAWDGSTRTSQLNRPLQSLAGWLFAEEHFPDGVIISTGTGIVPGMDFTLQPGDLVTIEIGEIGTLTNRVVAGKTELEWLGERASRVRSE
jgi:2-dehydro-3-deoxy-D-arabinonate dehydratase